MTADRRFHIARTHLGSDGVLIGVAAPFFIGRAEPVTESHIPALYNMQLEK